MSDGRFASNPDEVAAQRQAEPNLEYETPLQELFEDQLACADLVNAATQAQVVDFIERELPRSVKIVLSDRSLLDPSVMLGFQTAVEDNLDTRPSHHDTEADHDHDDEITSTYLILHRAFDPDELKKRLEVLV